MYSIYKSILVAICISSASSSIGTQFLAVPVSAIELGLGRHPTMTWGININPALIGQFDHGTEMSFSLGEWLKDVQTSSVTFITPLLGGAGGFQIRYVGLNDLELRPNVPLDEPIGTFDAYGTTLDLLYAHERHGLNFGVALHTLYMQIFTESTYGLAFDIGILHTTKHGLKIGGSILNIGRTGELYKNSPEMPIRITGGIAHQHQIGSLMNTIYLSGEHSRLNKLVLFKIGNESRWNELAIRINTQISKNSISYGGGIGFSAGIYQLNYGLNFDSNKLGISQTITVSARFP
ncbi:hypothetical protein ACFL46_02130 [Candidatus Neomarinimicrobiota bacterium]